MTSQRTIVIGDIHGNMPALHAACAKARSLGYDQMVLMGDLLSYGVDTAEVLAKAAELSAIGNTVLLKGNHDAFYLQKEWRAATAYFNSLPAWIRESIEYTRTAPGLEQVDRLPFVEFMQRDGLYFSHANPFGQDDWSYLNSLEAHRAAAGVLSEKNCFLGIFAHTHRCRAFAWGSAGEIDHLPLEELRCARDAGTTWILNAGSIGQPRDAAKVPFVVCLDGKGRAVQARFLSFDYDRNVYLSAVRNSRISAATKEKLLSFFA